MALSFTVTGAQIAAAIKAQAALIGTGAPVTDAQLEAVWKAAIEKLYEDFANNAEVDPGSFVDGMMLPVTGTGGPVT